MNGVRGIRWKCTRCNDTDLCHDCYVSNKHDLSHAFTRYDTPLSVGYSNHMIVSIHCKKQDMRYSMIYDTTTGHTRHISAHTVAHTYKKS